MLAFFKAFENVSKALFKNGHLYIPKAAMQVPNLPTPLRVGKCNCHTGSRCVKDVFAPATAGSRILE